MLPGYDKNKRKKSFATLPKGAYVIEILQAREEANKNGNGSHLTIAFDIAEGEHKNFFSDQYRANTNEDKNWPNDGVYYLSVPDDSSKEYVWQNWNTFFADLEDSNNGFIFAGNCDALKGKKIGGKFAIEQTEYNGNIYDHTKLRWTCVADDVRNGTAGQMPKDKLITSFGSRPETPETPAGMFVNFDPEKEGLPFA